MAKRESIHIPGVQHSQPIPFASKVGNMLFTGAIMGTDASTGKVPEGAEEQVKNCFTNLKTTLDTAGFSPEDIGFMSVYLKSNDVRQHVRRRVHVRVERPLQETADRLFVGHGVASV